MCIDGTPGFFSIRSASSAASRRKWLLFYQGGGWCSPSLPEDFAGPEGAALDSCYHRYATDLGGSSGFKDRMNATDATSWFSDLLSADRARNPLLHDWNAVLFRYCDGGSYSGMRLASVTQGGRRLHLKGGFIREAFLGTLRKEYGLDEATEVVVSGCSAGGLATYFHADWWQAALPSAFVAALPDSGYFLDRSGTPGLDMPGPYGPFMRRIFHEINASHGVNAACVSDKASRGGDPSDCFFAQYTVPYVTPPLWVSQSIYDHWQITNELGFNSSRSKTDVARVIAYGRVMRGLLAAALDDSTPRSGGFIDSCEHHCGQFTTMQINGELRIDAFGRWYAAQLAGARTGSPATLWQLQPWNCSDCCTTA